MKQSIFAILAGCLVLLSGYATILSAGEEQYQGAKLTTDGKGTINSMRYSRPSTYLNIESEFLFVLNGDGVPTNGTVFFNNGVRREMNPGEVNLYFQECGGPNTVWDYYKEQGRVVTYSLDNGKIPSTAFGKKSRLTIRSGWRFIGRLDKLADKPDGVSLTVEGASGGPIPFYENTVVSVEQMK